jgi:hypothetical protein
MVGQESSRYNLKRGPHGPLTRTKTQRRYFYVDGDLYKILLSDRANDVIRAWSFTDQRIVQFIYSDIVKNSQQAFDTEEVCRMLNRTRRNVLEHVATGSINPPYRIGENAVGRYKWSEDDVRALHEHYLTLGSGRPRKDGIVTAAPRIPSRLELVAMMQQQRMIYVQDDKGNFVPIFDQPDWT